MGKDVNKFASVGEQFDVGLLQLSLTMRRTGLRPRVWEVDGRDYPIEYRSDQHDHRDFAYIAMPNLGNSIEVEVTAGDVDRNVGTLCGFRIYLGTVDEYECEPV